MSGNRQYHGIIWTNHALERLGQRGLSQEIAWQTIRYAERSNPSQNGGTKFERRFDKSTVTVIAKKNERGEWIVLSNWIDPPLYGTEDHKNREAYKQYKKASGIKKFFLALIKQIRG